MSEVAYLTTAATYCLECKVQIWWTWDEDGDQMGIHPTNSCSHSTERYEPPQINLLPYEA